MNSLPYPDDILDSFCSGDYLTDQGELIVGQRQKFNEAFTFVDGLEYPLSMVHPEIPQEGDQLGMIGVDKVHGVPVRDYVRYRIRKDLDADYPAYKSTRALFGKEKFDDTGLGSRSKNTTYVSELGLSEKRFRALISRLSAHFNHRALTVLDLGCGQGVGYKQLLKMDEIDEDTSVGLTLPLADTWAYPNTDLLYVNIMHCGQKRESDFTLSAHGCMRYHPTNFYEQRYPDMLVMLQAVNLTRPGGMILYNVAGMHSINKLINDRILRFDSLSETMALRVLRHPTVDEVMDYMRPKTA